MRRPDRSFTSTADPLALPLPGSWPHLGRTRAPFYVMSGTGEPFNVVLRTGLTSPLGECRAYGVRTRWAADGRALYRNAPNGRNVRARDQQGCSSRGVVVPLWKRSKRTKCLSTGETRKEGLLADSSPVSAGRDGTLDTIVQVLAHHGEVGLSDFVRHSLGAVPTRRCRAVEGRGGPDSGLTRRDAAGWTVVHSVCRLCAPAGRHCPGVQQECMGCRPPSDRVCTGLFLRTTVLFRSLSFGPYGLLCTSFESRSG